MKTVAISMVRDEADIIGPIIRHMATQVDAIIVADNGSVDGTRVMLRDLSRELGQSGFVLTLVDDTEIGYTQSAKMTALALRARLELGADWIVPFDADELWYSPDGRIGDLLVGVQAHLVAASLFDHVCTGQDGPGNDATVTMRYRKIVRAPLPKVACRWEESLTIGMGNHDASYDHQFTSTRVPRIEIRHFPYRSAEQVIRKIRNGAQAYAATDLPEMYGAHWRQWGRILDEQGPEAIAALFRQWHYREDPDGPTPVDLPALRYDPAPVES